MALSNIVREPRREITESLIGFGIFALFVWGDYEFGCWLERFIGYRSNGWAIFPWPIGMLMGIALAIIGVLIVFVTHALGNSVCNFLQKNGIHLRPQRRP